MLKENQLIKTQWNPFTKKYYESLGYEYTGKNTELWVKIEDLPLNSHIKVEVICDFCGKEYSKVYKDYNLQHNGGDCCVDCEGIKSLKTGRERYGKNYRGEILREISLERYGVEWYSQTKEYKETYKNTCQQRYGTDNVFQSDIIKERIRQTMQNKYGVDNPSQCPKIHAKAMESFCRDGGQKSSKQQDAVFQMLLAEYGNCELNKVVDFYVADCLLTIDDIVIDVEYDGWYWHQNSQKRDKQRDGYMYSKGYKVLRIKGGVEIPTIAQLQNAINRLLDGEQYVEIILDWKN